MPVKINYNHTITFVFLFSFMLPLFWLPPYADDIMRFHWGYIGLFQQGRPVTELYYKLLNGLLSNNIFDIYKLNLIVSFILLFVSLLALRTNINDNLKFITPLAIISVFASPFILQNLSFHVDVIGMSISISLSILSACLFKDFNIRDVIISLTLLIVATLAYQSSINIFISCVALIAYINSMKADNLSDKVNIKFLTVKIFVFATAMIVVYLVNRSIITDAYALNHSKIVNFSDSGILVVVDSLSRVLNLIIGSFNPVQKFLLAMTFVSAFLGFVVSLFRLFRGSRKVDALIAMASASVIIGFVFLPTVIFSDPVVRPRVLISFGFLLALSLIASSSVKLLAIVCAACFSIYAFTVLATSSSYVSAANKQFERQNDMIKQISSDFRYGLNDYGIVKVKFSGRLKVSKLETMSVNSFPVIGRLLVPFYGDAWNSLGIISNANVPISVVKKFNDVGAQKVLETSSYDIFRDSDGVYLVKFN